MKRVLITIIVLFAVLNLYSQSLDFLVELEQEDEIYFDYKYDEFNQYAYLDSTIILESFDGVQNLYKDSIDYSYSQNMGAYYFTVEKIGIKTKRTFFDTISVENVNTKSKIVIYESVNIDTIGAENQITGWIFADTLYESVVDSMDTIPMYPYSRLYRYYYPENDDSLFYQNDTIFIHSRPYPTNYFDSYFSIDYYIRKNHGLIYYSKKYWYYGTGFNESYELTGAALIDGIEQVNETKLENYSLSQNYPNPFNPSTKIEYRIQKTEFVSLKIYDVLGREVATLVNEEQKAGSYDVNFNASDLPSGLYIYRLQVHTPDGKGNFTQAKKMLLLK